VESVHEGKRHTCDQCGYQATTEGHLKRHKKSVHNATYNCEFCEFQTLQKLELIRHKYANHEGQKFQCNLCDYQASRRTHLKHHQERLHSEKKYSCQLCEFESKTNIELKKHIRAAHNKLKPGEKKFTCNLCDYVAAKKIHLKSHHQQEHFLPEKIPDEDYEEKHKTQSQISDLDLDVNTLADFKNFDPCLDCGILFESKEATEKETLCNDCKQKEEKETEVKNEAELPSIDSVIPIQYLFEDPKKIESTDIPVKVECEGATNSEEHISDLGQTKQDLKLKICDQCDFKTLRKSDLNQHIKAVHLGIRYPCSRCDYQAPRKRRLLEHELAVHEGMKYPCPQCEYQATTRGHLTKHINSIHDKGNHPCDLCDYKANRREHLLRHKDNKLMTANRRKKKKQR
jgi:KRAB domain-containing zinc finger protein